MLLTTTFEKLTQKQKINLKKSMKLFCVTFNMGEKSFKINDK